MISVYNRFKNSQHSTRFCRWCRYFAIKSLAKVHSYSKNRNVLSNTLLKVYKEFFLGGVCSVSQRWITVMRWFQLQKSKGQVEWFTLLVRFHSMSFFTPTPSSLPVAIQGDGRICQPIAHKHRGIFLQGADWPNERSYAVSNPNIPWHVALAPGEYNLTWLVGSAGRHDFGLSSNVHHIGPGALWKSGGAGCYLCPVPTGDLDGWWKVQLMQNNQI